MITICAMGAPVAGAMAAARVGAPIATGGSVASGVLTGLGVSVACAEMATRSVGLLVVVLGGWRCCQRMRPRVATRMRIIPTMPAIVNLTRRAGEGGASGFGSGAFVRLL